MIPFALLKRQHDIETNKPYEKRSTFYQMLDKAFWKPMPGNARDVKPDYIWKPSMPYSYVDNRPAAERNTELILSKTPMINAPGIDGDWGTDTNILRQALRQEQGYGKSESMLPANAGWGKYIRPLFRYLKAKISPNLTKYKWASDKDPISQDIIHNHANRRPASWFPKDEKEFWNYINNTGRYTPTRIRPAYSSKNRNTYYGRRNYGGRTPFYKRRKRLYPSVFL